MKKLIYDFTDYRDYLRCLAGGARQRTGFSQSLAKALDSYSSFISKVLKKETHLSPEQAQKANVFLAHTEVESHYFILLVQYERSGTNELKAYYKKLLNQAMEQYLNIKKRLNVKATLNRENQAIYYSSWRYAAIHVALSIAYLQTPKSLSEYFGLSQRQVNETLEFLLSVGLAELKDGHYRIGATQIHLESDSPNIIKHHTNWRNQAVLSLDHDSSEDLHYSASVTLSRADVEKVKDIIIKSLEKSLAVIHSSPEEEVYCLTADFFKLKRTP